jgi:hypothetical protein
MMWRYYCRHVVLTSDVAMAALNPASDVEVSHTREGKNQLALLRVGR